MENAVEALKLAFAVILLTLALSLSVSFFSKARSTSEMVLKAADTQRYYDFNQYTIPEDPSGNRIVGYETIIPTLYKYDKERYKVIFKEGNYDSTTGVLTDVKPLEIYSSTSNKANWSEDYINDFDGYTNYERGSNKNICSFDIVEEIQRGEPWVGNSEQIKLHLDAIFSGGTYQLPQYGSGHEISYANNPLSKRDSKFIEQIGEITATEGRITGNKTTTKRIITYIKIN